MKSTIGNVPPFYGVDRPGDPTFEKQRLNALSEDCSMRVSVFQPLHSGTNREETKSASYLPLISSHLLSLRETCELTERHEAFSGHTSIYLRESIANETGDFRGCCAGVEPWDGKLRKKQEARIQQLKENHLRSRKRKERIWIEQLHPQKWRCLHDLHTLAAESKKQRQPTPLDRAFINGSSHCFIPKAAFMSLFLTNFSFTEKEMLLCSEALSCLFAVLDKNFDDLVDYREFLCHYYAMGTLRLEAKLSKCFYFFVGLDKKISLHQLWQIIAVTGSEEQLEIIAKELRNGLKRMASMQKYAAISGSLQLIVEKCIMPYDWEKLVKDATREVINRVQRRNPHLNQLHAVNKVVEPHFTENKRDGLVDVRIDKATFDELLALCDGSLRLLRKLYWERNPLHVKASVMYANMEASATKFKKTNHRINLIRAKSWWHEHVIPNRLQIRFNQWRAHTKKQCDMKLALSFWRRRRQSAGIRSLGLWAEEAMFESQRNQLAETFCCRRLKRQAFAHLREVVDIEKSDFDLQYLIAITHHARTLSTQSFSAWREGLQRTRRIKEMLNRWRSREKYTLFHLWRENVQAIREARITNERLGKVRQSMLNSDLQEYERLAEKERIRLEKEQEQLRLIEEQREKERQEEEEVWKERRRAAQDNVYKTKLLQKQEEERVARKKAMKQKEEDDQKRIWDELMKKNKKQARMEAEAFIRTDEAAAMLNKNAIEIQHDPSVVATDGVNGDDWQKLFDPNLEIYFLYNTETGEKVYTEGLTKDEALQVAKTNYINRQIQLAEEATRALRAREEERRLKENAVKTIANFLRTRKCRLIVQERIAQSYMKRLDPYNGKMYYYNLVKRKRVGQKPLNLGKQDIKPLQWYLRLDGEGNAFYENAISPWLSSSVKPAAILPCSVCELHLAVYTCSTCNEHTCVDCFENKHDLDSDHSFERAFQIVPKMCVCCKEKEACRHCTTCGLHDFYCERCYRLTHPKQNKKRAAHVSILF